MYSESLFELDYNRFHRIPSENVKPDFFFSLFVFFLNYILENLEIAMTIHDLDLKCYEDYENRLCFYMPFIGFESFEFKMVAQKTT